MNCSEDCRKSAVRRWLRESKTRNPASNPANLSFSGYRRAPEKKNHEANKAIVMPLDFQLLHNESA
jgi:hypothetical protein